MAREPNKAKQNSINNKLQLLEGDHPAKLKQFLRPIHIPPLPVSLPQLVRRRFVIQQTLEQSHLECSARLIETQSLLAAISCPMANLHFNQAATIVAANVVVVVAAPSRWLRRARGRTVGELASWHFGQPA